MNGKEMKLRIHLGQHEQWIDTPEGLSASQQESYIKALKQVGENNGVSVTLQGETENGFFGGTGIASLDQERLDRFYQQAALLEQKYLNNERVKVKDETRVKPVHRGGILLGTLGALLGGVVGALLFAAVAAAGFLFSFFGFGIAYAASYGYDLLNGRQGQTKQYVLYAVVIFSSILAMLFLSTVYLSGTGQFNLLQAFTMNVQFFFKHPLNYLDRNFLFVLIFGLLGVWSSSRFR